MPFDYTIFFAGIINVILAVIVLISDSKSKNNIFLSVFFLNLSLWNIFLFYELFYGKEPYVHFLYATVSLLPVSSYLFLDCYIKKTETFKVLKISILTFSSIFFVLSLMRILTNYIYHNILVLYLLFSFIIMDIFLLIEYKNEINIERKLRLKYIFFALSILLALGSTDFMTFFDFLRPVMLGNIGSIIFVFVMSYIIISKDILPVNHLLLKSFIYFIIILLLGFVGYLIIYGLKGFSIILYVKAIVTVTVVVILYKIMEEGIYRLSDKLLSVDEYRYQQLIKDFEEDNLKGENLAGILKKLIDGLFEILKLRSASLLSVYNNKNDILYYRGENCKNLLGTMSVNWNKNGIVYFKKNKKDIVLYGIRTRGVVVCLIGRKNSMNKRKLLLMETIMKQVQNIIDRSDLLKKIDSMEKIAFAGEVASGIAHDIRNPLSSIKGAVQYVEDSIPAEDREYLDIIYEDINRIENIIERFQIFAATRDTVKSKIEVSGFIENIKRRFKNCKLDIVNRIREKSFNVDPILLEEIVYNIIQNAFDAYEKKGGKVEMVLEKNNKELLIKIRDWGKGIDKNTGEKIFNPFFTTRSNGIGLGLSITRKMINSCNGTIRYENNEDGGTTFFITMENVW